MLPAEFRQTTGFRLTLAILGVFGAAALVLIGLLYYQTAVYLIHGGDEELRREATSLQYVGDTEARRRLAEHVALDPRERRPYGLFDKAGKPLAGNLIKLPRANPPTEEIFQFNQDVRGKQRSFRGLAVRTRSGNLLMVAQDVDELEDFTQALGKALMISGAVALLLGLLAAVMIGRGSARRLGAITESIERIAAGDLSRRLPDTKGSSDIDRLARGVNHMLDDIERLMGEVKGVCDSIAHDMRTPLTRLLAGLERARRPSATQEDVMAAIDRGIESIHEILKTFNALLRISEVESGARSAAFAEVDLGQIARDVVEFHDVQAETKTIQLMLEGDEGPLRMVGDADLLFEAIANLVDNAIKFTPVDGKVNVRLSPEPGISVIDNGPGISAEEREQVLLRFYRGEESRSEPGNGLGLALVAAIARLHRMDLSIDDANPGCIVSLAVH